jgi:hypothetical protein
VVVPVVASDVPSTPPPSDPLELSDEDEHAPIVPATVAAINIFSMRRMYRSSLGSAAHWKRRFRK